MNETSETVPEDVRTWLVICSVASGLVWLYAWWYGIRFIAVSARRHRPITMFFLFLAVLISLVCISQIVGPVFFDISPTVRWSSAFFGRAIVALLGMGFIVMFRLIFRQSDEDLFEP